MRKLILLIIPILILGGCSGKAKSNTLANEQRDIYSYVDKNSEVAIVSKDELSITEEYLLSIVFIKENDNQEKSLVREGLVQWIVKDTETLNEFYLNIPKSENVTLLQDVDINKDGLPSYEINAKFVGFRDNVRVNAPIFQEII